MKDVGITMPIAPGLLALQTHNPSVQGYKRLTAAHVDDLNRRAVGFCDKLFVSISPETRPIWFDPGAPAADAWENRVKEEEPRRTIWPTFRAMKNLR